MKQSTAARRSKSHAFQRFVLMLITTLSLTNILHAADATFSLPLQGYYRPGRSMPLRVSAQTDSPKNLLLLRAAGALSLEIQPREKDRIDATFPWLAIRSIHDVNWTVAGTEHAIDLPLHAMDQDERLIAYVGTDPDVLTSILPGGKLIRVQLDPADPLPGDISAWEALDGLVLDAASAGKLTEGRLRALLSGGTIVAIRTRQPPKDDWHWQQQGAYWICRADIAGPTSAYVPDAYGPTQAWQRGWPASFRHAIILSAIVFGILVTAITLWRSRWMVVGVIILSVAATILAIAWRANQSPAIEAGGSIIVLTGTTTQRDAWTYRAMLREGDGEFVYPSMSRPVFGYRQQADDIRAKQVCAPDGNTTVRYHLKPGQSIAFQSRTLLENREDVHAMASTSSPLHAMADQLYVSRNHRILGDVAPHMESHWPDVLVERMSATPPP